MKSYLKIRIEADELGLPGNRHHCAIANAIMLADADIVHVRVDEDNIRFSRRSDGTRYTFTTPSRAATFIREFDRLIAAADGGGRVRAMTARSFTLELTDQHLINATPRAQRRANYVIHKTATQAYGPTLAKSPVVQANGKTAKATAAAAAAAPEPPKATITIPPPRQPRKAAPRKRPSQRV